MTYRYIWQQWGTTSWEHPQDHQGSMGFMTELGPLVPQNYFWLVKTNGKRCRKTTRWNGCAVTRCNCAKNRFVQVPPLNSMGWIGFMVSHWVNATPSMWNKCCISKDIFTQLTCSWTRFTNARVKSYQLVKVVSGGRAPGKSSSLASPQLLVIERFHCFGAVRLEKNQFLYATAFGTCIWSYFQWGIRC